MSIDFDDRGERRSWQPPTPFARAVAAGNPEALKRLEELKSDDSLIDTENEYPFGSEAFICNWQFAEGSVLLDGQFTIDQLERVVATLKAKAK